jgi:hypothetical protein
MNNINIHCHEKLKSSKIKITLREIQSEWVETVWTDYA